MIVRDARRQVIDHGPIPATSLGGTLPSGHIARPDSSARPEKQIVVPERTPGEITRDWKRRKRASDPDWVERQRVQARERYFRNKARAA